MMGIKMKASCHKKVAVATATLLLLASTMPYVIQPGMA